MSGAGDQPTSLGNGIARDADAPPSRLVLRRLGIDTYQEHIVYMRSDCHVCRSEGFEARSRVRVSTEDNSLLATLNVIKSDLLGTNEASAA
jgi:thymidine phosphorylase